MTLRYVYALAALLTAIGISMFLYKWQVLGFPVTDKQKTPVWTIETAIHFDSGPGSIKANLQIPTLTPGFRMLRKSTCRKGTGSVSITSAAAVNCTDSAEENFCA